MANKVSMVLFRSGLGTVQILKDLERQWGTSEEGVWCLGWGGVLMLATHTPEPFREMLIA